MNKINATILILLVLSLFKLYGEDNYLYQTVQASILVSNPERIVDSLVAWTEERGGYFLFKSNERVDLRIPVEYTGKFRSFLEDTAEFLFSYSSNAGDLRDEMVRLQSGIAGREEILQKNLSYIDKANVQGTLAIEKEVTRLLTEIESMKGRLQKLKQDCLFSSVQIQLSFKEKELPDNIRSSFNWLNGVNFYWFVQNPSEGPNSIRGRIQWKVPEDFALLNSVSGVISAVSPEGAFIRIMAVANYPLMDLGFWSSALENQLRRAGYSGMDQKGTISASGIEGAYFEWGLPLRGKNYIYMTAVFIKGKRIYLVEEAGEVAIYSRYRDTVLKSLSTLELQ